MGSGDFDSELDVASCGESSGCVTYPKDCTPETCHFAVSYKTVSDGIRFRLTNKRAAVTSSYAALGISLDQKMVSSLISVGEIISSSDFVQDKSEKKLFKIFNDSCYALSHCTVEYPELFKVLLQ